jgi:hypothetical protein
LALMALKGGVMATKKWAGRVVGQDQCEGRQFMTGEIAGVGDVVCFKAKVTERGPTWRVFKSQPREATQTREDVPSSG